MLLKAVLLALLCSLLLVPAGRAQIPEQPISFWPDSFLIRHHIGDNVYGESGNALHELVYWQQAAAHYASLLPRLLRYDAIAAAGAHRVQVRHYFVGHDRAYWPRFREPSGTAIAGRLDTIAATLTLTDRQELLYDDKGYLLQRIREKYFSDTTVSERDTVTLTYQQAPGGELDVTYAQVGSMAVSAARTGTGYIYGSVCCGNFSKGPFTLRKDSRSLLHFDRRMLLSRLVSSYDEWANGCRNQHCKDGDTGAHILAYSYDAQGRIQRISDSSAAKGRLSFQEEYQYTDHSLADAPAAQELRVLQAPLMQQYLNTLRRPVLTTVAAQSYYWANYADRDYLSVDSPATSVRQIHGIWDAAHQLRLRFGINVLSQREVIAYRAGGTAVDSYHNATALYDLEKNTDDAVYFPQPYRNIKTLHMGCVIRDYYEQPRGTVRSGTPGVSERIVFPRTAAGWQLITYDRMHMVTGYEETSFWAPQSFERYPDPWTYPNTFVVCDKRGLVRYFYKEGHLYLLDYK